MRANSGLCQSFRNKRSRGRAGDADSDDGIAIDAGDEVDGVVEGRVLDRWRPIVGVDRPPSESGFGSTKRRTISFFSSRRKCDVDDGNRRRRKRRIPMTAGTRRRRPHFRWRRGGRKTAKRWLSWLRRGGLKRLFAAASSFRIQLRPAGRRRRPRSR